MKVHAIATLLSLSLTWLLLPMTAASSEEPKPATGTLKGFDRPAELGEFVDADGDGVVTDAEAKAAAANIQKESNGRKKTDRGAAVLAALDKNKDGKLDQQEAEEGVAAERRERDEIGRKVGEMFDKLDTSGDGLVGPDEFKQLIEKLGPLGKLVEPRLAQFFNAMDANGDTQISNVESQFAADFFAAQANIRRQQETAAANAKLTAIVQGTFAQLDKNNNRKISLREAKANSEVESKFGLIDKNDDKNLTSEEVYKFLELSEKTEE